MLKEFTPTLPTARAGWQPGRILKAAGLYFALVFGTGFVLGTLRVLLLVPRVGERAAELAETPLMLAAIFLAARFTVRRLRLWPVGASSAAAGLLALVFVLAVEFTVVIRLRGMTLAEYRAGRDPVAGAVYAVSLLLFAAAPWLVSRVTRRRTAVSRP